MKDEYILVVTTFSDRNAAKSCGEELLKRHLVACCQITEIESMYRWKGQIENDKEYKVEMKTKKVFFQEIKKFITDIHSYDIPEIVVYKIIDGSESYMQWIEDELKILKE
ncbi:MAG: divalent-cation tolerance protein CutA [Desulfovibrio sp.]|nr:divalent-cation tolerance protein CutA [Desulfovibrio sp.]